MMFVNKGFSIIDLHLIKSVSFYSINFCQWGMQQIFEKAFKVFGEVNDDIDINQALNWTSN